MKRLLTNKKFIEIAFTILTFIIMTVIFYAISQCVSGSINIQIGVN